jgi:hypothetical protein
MLKSFFLVFVPIILAGQLFAQQGFYLKPLLQFKWNHSRDPVDYNISLTPHQPVQIISMANYRTKGFEIGAILGYNFKKSSIEIGVCQDGTNSGFTVRGMSHGQHDSLFHLETYSSYGGLVMTKIPIHYQLRLWKIDSLHHDPRAFSLEICAFLGIDLIFKPRGDPNTPNIISGYEFYQGGGKYIDLIDKLYATGEHWGYLNTIGLTFKLNKRDRNILNIRFHASIGAINFSYKELSIVNTDGTTYVHNELSDASGYYLTISKELNLRKIRKHYF